MSQGSPAPSFGVIAPPLADGVTTHSGTPIAFNPAGAAIPGAKVSGSALVVAVATAPRENGETQPALVLGPLTLTTEQWDAVTLQGGGASTGGLVPGAVYVQWSGGLMNEGSAFMSFGDIRWVVGVALLADDASRQPRDATRSSTETVAMRMTKREIENVGRAGGGARLDGADVATVNYKRGTVTLRHVWPDGTDARVWSAVSAAAWALAKQTAKALNKPVEIYSKHGDMLDQIDPR